MKIEDEVWEAVQEGNRAWTRGRDCSRLREFFHEDMVAIGPTQRERSVGREVCVAGWQAFANMVEIQSWKESDPLVQLYADDRAAIVTYYYEMDCVMGGQQMLLTGRDMMTLVNENGKWWLVADQFSGYPGGRG